MSKHTPIPWEMWDSIDDPNTPGSFALARHLHDNQYSVLGNFWANANADIADEELEANARHIVKCVNAHDKLVAEARNVIGFVREVPEVLTDAPGIARIAERLERILKEIDNE